MIILADDRQGPYYPSGHNILAAMDWLVSEPHTQCFLHYSGHGGQVQDPDGDRHSGFDSTIVPVDYQQQGQLDSDTLHRHLVSRLPPSSTLFVVFDCCHSGRIPLPGYAHLFETTVRATGHIAALRRDYLPLICYRIKSHGPSYRP